MAKGFGGHSFTGVRDMFDGGGAGASGATFGGGGMLSLVANEAGVRPLGQEAQTASASPEAQDEAVKRDQFVKALISWGETRDQAGHGASRIAPITTAPDVSFGKMAPPTVTRPPVIASMSPNIAQILAAMMPPSRN